MFRDRLDPRADLETREERASQVPTPVTANALDVAAGWGLCMEEEARALVISIDSEFDTTTALHSNSQSVNKSDCRQFSSHIIEECPHPCLFVLNLDGRNR